MIMFLLSLVKGSKSAEGGPNPLADMDPGGPNPLADMDRGVIPVLWLSFVCEWGVGEVGHL